MILTVLRALLASVLLFLLAESVSAKGQKYAILIGVRNYESTALRDLEFAENDVSQLADVLKDNGFVEDNIVLMTATHAAKSRKPRLYPRAKNIRKELGLYLSLPQKGDTVVVALAGHGVQFKGDSEHYFCPVDADLANKSNLISVNDLYKALEKCRADIRLLFVDACRNDPLTGKTPRSVSDNVVSKTRPAIAAPPGGVAAFFSCSKGQEAFESGKLKHGVFFHFVLEGLRGKASNSDSEVTVGSLTEFVSRKVSAFAVKELGTLQRPELLGRHNPSVPLVRLKKPLPKTRLVTLPGGVKMELVLVPKGIFWMSHDRADAQKRVTIEAPFYIGKYEVTQEQWKAVMGKNPSEFSAERRFKDLVQSGAAAVAEFDRYPVENVSWNDCQAFLKKLNKHAEKQRVAFSLPTDAQWEYACRAASQTKAACSYNFYFEKPTNRLSSKQANFDGTRPQRKSDPKGPYLKRTTQVGSYSPNALGIYDMHGNVYEWCRVPDAEPSSSQVVRGGAWDSPEATVCASAGYKIGADNRKNYLGFRCVAFSVSK